MGGQEGEHEPVAQDPVNGTARPSRRGIRHVQDEPEARRGHDGVADSPGDLTAERSARAGESA